MTDESLMEIRTIRHEISAEFEHDIEKYIAYLQHQAWQYDGQIGIAEQMLRTQESPKDIPRLRKVA